ncbi:UDP binding domain-containing protein [Thermodesulfovibrionales bacterium]|nr:UDP binding domain-containing protein [Thermodesulfovibrionales bacterium]
MREAPAKVIVPALIDSGAKLLACDPVATGQAKSIFGKYNEGIKYVDNMFDAVAGVDALVLITEWKQFRQPDFLELKNRMKNQLFLMAGINITRLKCVTAVLNTTVSGETRYDQKTYFNYRWCRFYRFTFM